jgi:hypothetical protein
VKKSIQAVAPRGLQSRLVVTELLPIPSLVGLGNRIDGVWFNVDIIPTHYQHETVRTSL